VKTAPWKALSFGYHEAVHTRGPNHIKYQPGPGYRNGLGVDAGNISFGITCPFGDGFYQLAAGLAQTLLSGNPDFDGTLSSGFDTRSDNASIQQRASNEGCGMSRMRKITKTVAFAVCALIIGLTTAVYALFHGYFDRGQFEVEQAEWSSSRQIALIVKRSDQEALDGYTYFVLIGDHSFSPAELRRAYHTDARVFATASSCLTLHWEGPNKLVVECNDSSITPDRIDVQKWQSGGTAISYINIPTK